MTQKCLFSLSLALVLIVPAKLSATQWHQSKNDLSVSLATQFSDNLYYQDSNPESSLSSALEMDYDRVALFEGFAIQVPFQLRKKTYFSESSLNHFYYKFTPALNIFLSEQSDLTFKANAQQAQKIKGEKNAEFLPEIADYVEEKDHSAALNLRLGRAPEKQYLNLEIATNHYQQEFEGLALSKTDSNIVSARYGHKISEDSYALADGTYKDEKRNDLTSSLVELGFGLYTRLGGSNQFNIVVGYFERSGDASSDGYYWMLSDKWRLSEDVELSLLSEQHSEISLSQQSLTQLTTENDISLRYQLNSEHYLNLSLSQINQNFDQSNDYHKRLVAAFDWQWRPYEGFNVDTSLALERVDTSLLDKQVNQQSAEVALEYLW